MKNYIEIKNNSSIPISSIPVIEYSIFYSQVNDLLQDSTNHCVAYFVYSSYNYYKFICCIASDKEQSILVLSHEHTIKPNLSLPSLTKLHFQFHVFERDIFEKFGIFFVEHPWLKPLRYPFNRFNKQNTISSYPFYSIDSAELHEVGVGPIHAGIIEPGYFRFICNGENVLHLEIQLGYQHRGVQELMINNNKILNKIILSECIAGDTAIGHSLCQVQLLESFLNFIPPNDLSIERTIALEFERIAVHIGDTAALCNDVAYQLGQVVNEALRTIVINTLQLWCGNRFGKGLIRTFGTHYRLNKNLINTIINNLNEVEKRYRDITDRIFTLPSLLSRFEEIGIVTRNQVLEIGSVGMAARSSGLLRDIRTTHPFLQFAHYIYEPIIIQNGDVFSRALMRKLEVFKSINIIKNLLKNIKTDDPIQPKYNLHLPASTFAISLIEGWRGELCHTAITDTSGNITVCNIYDASLHNWYALALAVRNQEISDFPLCNKSFNLSYCGNDL